MDTTAVIAATVGGVPAVVAAWFAFKSSARATATTEEANRLAATKVDAEAYERSKAFYENMLAEADKHLERLRKQVDGLSTQLERVNTQLATEQDVSNVLRNQVRALTVQVGTMEQTLTQLGEQIPRRPVR